MSQPCTVALPRLDEGSGRTLEISGRALILLRHQGRYYCYENRCPHTGVELHWLADQFLSKQGPLQIICSTHGARFEPSTGLCVFGPCQGQALTPIDLELRDGAPHLQVAPQGPLKGSG